MRALLVIALAFLVRCAGHDAGSALAVSAGPKNPQTNVWRTAAHRHGEIRVFNAAGELEQAIPFDERSARQRV